MPITIKDVQDKMILIVNMLNDYNTKVAAAAAANSGAASANAAAEAARVALDSKIEEVRADLLSFEVPPPQP